MALKSEPARLAFVFGMILAIAVIAVAITMWTTPLSSSAESIKPCQMVYQAQYLNGCATSGSRNEPKNEQQAAGHNQSSVDGPIS